MWITSDTNSIVARTTFLKKFLLQLIFHTHHDAQLFGAFYNLFVCFFVNQIEGLYEYKYQDIGEGVDENKIGELNHKNIILQWPFFKQVHCLSLKKFRE